jgi:hypothetical protein
MAAVLIVPVAAFADFVENFDEVTPPALPAGWMASNASGAAPFWGTTTTLSFSPFNNAYIPSPVGVSDKRLDTPPIPIFVATARLTFQNYYNLDNLDDGGVLEISIGGGPFTDIRSAGGSFAAGGYNNTLQGSGPLSGRQAWTGDSGGYITTIVNLPAAAEGTNIVLRFRMGSGLAFSKDGWISTRSKSSPATATTMEQETWLTIVPPWRTLTRPMLTATARETPATTARRLSMSTKRIRTVTALATPANRLPRRPTPPAGPAARVFRW